MNYMGTNYAFVNIIVPFCSVPRPRSRARPNQQLDNHDSLSVYQTFDKWPLNCLLVNCYLLECWFIANYCLDTFINHSGGYIH